MKNKMFSKIFIVILMILSQGLILAVRNYYLIYTGRDLILTRLIILIYFILSLILIKIICDRFINYDGDDSK